MKLSIFKSKNAVFKILLLSLATGLLIAIPLAFSLNYLAEPVAVDEVLYFEVKPGSPLQRVTADLNQRGYLKHPLLVNLLARYEGVAQNIQSGEYEIGGAISPRQLLSKMVAGETRQYSLTLLEGWTFKQALQAIWSSEKISRTLQQQSMEAIASQLQLDSPSPEGMLFPDTYFYTAHTSDLELLKRASARLQAILDQSWQNRLGALPYENSYQALIMASIIEKETGLRSEQRDIAAVFIRRLENGMRLQSDPTVIYGMGERYQGNIRREDLRESTAYNTYRINGLPPTPIALAGKEAIEASLNPGSMDYLYFVAKGDGAHHFSSSLEEHNEAVQRYQKSNN